MDIAGAGFGLALSLPLFPLIALAIKVSSPGSVFFCQERVGHIEREQIATFSMIKFRTMCQEAEAKTGAVWASKDDPRLTTVGCFLRKTRLDELPQFINVLKGEMSLIGPRPERPCIAKKLEDAIPFYLERTKGLRPGITGLAQVNQGYDESLDDVRSKLAYDLAYSMSFSHAHCWLKMELGIVFKTVWIMVTGRGQ
ncbi:MAG: sugar transferase [Pseudomonadales bacterium]|nr:sugar transferase [Pseudomonadales bacterium]